MSDQKQPWFSLSVAVGLVLAIVLTGAWFFSRSPGDDAVAGFTVPRGSLFGTERATSTTQAPSGAEKVTDTIRVTPGVERWYTNKGLDFSFRLPDGYSAPEFDTKTPGVVGVVVYKDENVPLVVRVYPIASGTRITPAGLRDHFALVGVRDIEERFIGTVVRGLAFRTSDPDWGGAAIGLWAPFNGRVYEIMTTAENQELFDFILANWFFAPPALPKPPTRP